MTEPSKVANHLIKLHKQFCAQDRLIRNNSSYVGMDSKTAQELFDAVLETIFLSVSVLYPLVYATSKTPDDDISNAVKEILAIYKSHFSKEENLKINAVHM
jgi:hypothetical protein